MNLTNIEIDMDKALKKPIPTNSAYKNYWDRMQLSEIKCEEPNRTLDFQQELLANFKANSRVCVDNLTKLKRDWLTLKMLGKD
jgi:hypothetical protein